MTSAITNIKLAAADTATATHAATTVTYGASAGKAHVIYGITFGYDATPTAPGTLTITVGGTTVFQISVPAAGLNHVHFPMPIGGTVGAAVAVSLSDGGVAKVGYVNVAKTLSTR